MFFELGEFLILFLIEISLCLIEEQKHNTIRLVSVFTLFKEGSNHETFYNKKLH